MPKKEVVKIKSQFQIRHLMMTKNPRSQTEKSNTILLSTVWEDHISGVNKEKIIQQWWLRQRQKQRERTINVWHCVDLATIRLNVVAMTSLLSYHYS